MTKAAPRNSARSLRQDFCPNSKFGKRRNPVCISACQKRAKPFFDSLEYCMYFSFFKLKKWGKKTAETRRRNCAVLPKRKNPGCGKSTSGTACQKSLAEFAARRRQRDSDYFLSGRVPDRKYNSGCKCAICTPRRTNRARGRLQSFCQKRAKTFFDSLSRMWKIHIREKHILTDTWWC